MKALSIRIPSLLTNIQIVESFIDNAKEKYEITDDIYGNMLIAVTESVNNAIKHGNKENEKKMVDLKLELASKRLRFFVRDEGKGFDYNNLIDPTSPENINNPGGRGIFLMKHLSDEVNFSEEGRLVELVFYLD